MSRSLCRWIGLILVCLLATGCWNRVEINDLAIVTEVGLDALEEERVLLSVNVVVPNRVGTPGGAGGGKAEGTPVLTFSETGRDVMDAISRLQLKVPRRLFWGHMRVLVLGEQFARNGVRGGIDFWTRYRQPRLTAHVLVAPAEAHTFLKSQPALRRLPSEALREVIEAKTGLEITIKDFFESLASHGDDPVAPRFEMVPAEVTEEEGAEVQMTGAALFRSDRLVGWLDTAQMRGLIWLRGESRQGTITLPMGDGQSIGMELIRSDVQVRARVERGRPVVEMSLYLETDVAENTTRLDLSQLEVISRLEKRLVKVLEERIRSTFTLITREYEVDAIGIGESLRRFDPQGWERVRRNWRERLPEAQIRLTVRAYIRRTGKHGPPLSLPEEELKKR